MTELSDNRITHLGMIQNVITRMADESARIKQFALAALAALASTSAATHSAALAYVAAVMAIVFWLLDARYLAQERWYRRLYDKVREGKGPTDFAMTPDADIRGQVTLATTAFGWSVAPLYGSLLIIAVLLAQVVPQSSVTAP